jgi:hypothetical protein
VFVSVSIIDLVTILLTHLTIQPNQLDFPGSPTAVVDIGTGPLAVLVVVVLAVPRGGKLVYRSHLGQVGPTTRS